MKRLNVKLIAVLLASTLVLVVLVHFVHGYQMGRNADVLLEQAEAARQTGNRAEAVKQYSQYLKYRPKDQKINEKFANLMVEIADQPGHTRRDVFAAWKALETTIRLYPELTQIRRKLVNYTMDNGRPFDAIKHIDELLATEEADPELQVRRRQCLLLLGNDKEATKLVSGLIGFDPTTLKFDSPKPATGPNELDAYMLMARIMFRPPYANHEVAGQIVDQMIAINKDNPKAYVERARYKLQAAGGKGVEEDIEQALKLGPDEPEVILLAVQMLMRDRKYAEAHALLDRCVAKHPKNETLYVALATVAREETKKLSEGIKQIEAGLKELPESQMLLTSYADMLMGKGDVAGVREQLVKMEQAGFMQEWVGYFRAQVSMHEKQWLSAARQLERLRPSVVRRPDMARQVDLFLAECYQNVGEPDRARVVAERVLESDPNSIRGLHVAANAWKALGKPDKSLEAMNKIKAILREKQPEDGTTTAEADNESPLSKLVQVELAKPKADRNWDQVQAALNDPAQTSKLTGAQIALLKADVLVMQDEFKKAFDVINAAIKDKPTEVPLWMMKISIADRVPLKPAKSGSDAMQEATANKRRILLNMVNQARASVGDIVSLRVAQANVLTRYKAGGKSDNKEVFSELEKLEQGIDAKPFTAEDQATFWNSQGVAYYRLRDYTNVRRCWSNAAKLRPDDLAIREAMFNLALEFSEKKDLDSALVDVRRVAGSDSPLYLYCVAARSINKVQRELHGKRGKEQEEAAELAQANTALNEAKRLRPGWHEIAHLMGTINDIQGNFDKALESYKESLQLGPANNAVSRRIVQLLFLLKRNDEATELMKSMPVTSKDRTVKRMEIEMASGEEKLEMARQAVVDDPDNVENYLVLAQVLETMDPPQPAEAEKQYRIAIEKAPDTAEPWLMLLIHLKRNTKGIEQKELVEAAKKRLPDDIKPAVLGPAYELREEMKAAEEQYLDAEKLHPGKISYMRDVASFYVRGYDYERRLASGDRSKTPQAAAEHMQKAADYQAKGLKYMDKILASKAEAEDQGHLAWARRFKARTLAALEGYENLQAAIRLIDQNAVGNVLLPEDMTLQADLLVDRSDFESRKKALEMYEKIRSTNARQLTNREVIALAGLYDHMGRWPDARDTMEGLLRKEKGNPGYLLALARMYIYHNELEKAGQKLNELNAEIQKGVAKAKESNSKDAAAAEMARLNATKVAAMELVGLWQVRKGDTKKALEAVKIFLDDTSPAGLEKAAALLESMGMNDEAAEKYREIAKEPRKELILAAFLGRHEGNDLDEVFALYQNATRHSPYAVIANSAVETLDARKAEADKRHYKIAMDLIEEGLAQKDKNSNELQVLKCQLLELQGRYDEVIPVYRAILADPKFNRLHQARVKNNLAYLLAVGGKKADAAESLKLINETISLLGPTCDVLDTRAVSYIANEQYGKAAADSNASLLENPNALKYYHLALALFRNGNNAKARENLVKAQEAKIESQIIPMERPAYDEMVRELLASKKKE